MKIVKWFLVVAVFVAAIIAGCIYFYPHSYVTPGGISLMRPPKGWVVRADTLTWDTQNQARGEHIEFSPTAKDSARGLVPPYVMVNLGPKTTAITGEAYIRDLKTEITAAGGHIVSEQPITIAGATGYDIELTVTENGTLTRGRVVVLEKDNMVYQITAVSEDTNWVEESSLLNNAINSLELTR